MAVLVRGVRERVGGVAAAPDACGAQLREVPYPRADPPPVEAGRPRDVDLVCRFEVGVLSREDGGVDVAREVVVRPIRSGTDFRGVLAGKTDEQGRSGVERLREERERDRASEAAVTRRYAGDDGSKGDKYADDYDEVTDVPTVRFRTGPA